MYDLLSKIGLITIVLIIIYIAKKIDDYYYYKKSICTGDENIYKAAKAFAQGRSTNEICNILEQCIEFDEEDVKEILTIALTHKNDEDRGYSGFIKAVNKVLGETAFEIPVDHENKGSRH